MKTKWGLRFCRSSLQVIIALGFLLGANNAFAAIQFLDDGAIPDPATPGWMLPPQGTCPADPTKTTRPDCLALRLNIGQASCTGNYSWSTGVCNDLVNNAGQAVCEGKGNRLWNAGTGVCAITLKGDDRNDVACMMHGGTWVTSGACVGNWVMPPRTAYTPTLLTGNFPGDQCLRCHNERTEYNINRVRDVESTIYMGHKNMTRKLIPGKAWGGPPMMCSLTIPPPLQESGPACEAIGGKWYPAEAYPHDNSDNVIDWISGKVTISNIQRDILWIYADWLSPYPRITAKLPPGSAKVCTNPTLSCAGSPASPCENAAETCVLNAGASYSCARCHTTGWTSDATIGPSTGIDAKEPEISFPGVTWDRLSDAPEGVVNLSGGILGDPNKYASWDVWGVGCTACHMSAIETASGTGSPPQYSAPAGMSSHHSNLTATDNPTGVCSNAQWTAEAQCTAAGGRWLTACSVNPTNPICVYANVTNSTDCATVAGTWTALPAWCTNAHFTNAADCAANGFVWQAGSCSSADAKATCSGGSGLAAKTWRTNGSKESCELGGGTWSYSKCDLAGACNKGTCSKPAHTDAVNCKKDGGIWTSPNDLAGCNVLGGQFRYATDFVRCENAGGEWTGNNLTRGGIITRVCMDCHRQDVSGMPYADYDAIPGSEATSHPGMNLKVANNLSTIRFPSYPAGNQFLNSVHARFSGTFAQIATAKNYQPGGYSSFFMNEGETQKTGNGCTGCHNVHRSTVEAAGAEGALKPCSDCHGGSYAVDLAKINHLAGVGTPMEHMAENPMKPCIVCHMPNGEHLWRINTDPAYSTFPAAAMNGVVNANTAPDGNFAAAVWVDLDAACGQCHGGGTNHASTAIAAVGGSPSATLTVASTAGFVAGQRISVEGAGGYAYDTAGEPVRGDFKSYIKTVSPPSTIVVAGPPPRLPLVGANVIQNPTTPGANYRTKAALAVVAEGMHQDANIGAQTTFAASVSGLTVNVAQNVSCAGPCPAFEYDWEWGDATPNGAGATASHTYAASGRKTITLTVRLAGGAAHNSVVGSVTRTVAVTPADNPPNVSGTSCVFDSNTWTATITDATTDDNAAPPTIVVDWGDGSRSVGAPNQIFTHTYGAANLYTASLKAVDSNARHSNTYVCADAMASPFTISGTVKNKTGSANLASAIVNVKKGGSTVKTVYTASNGTFSVTNLKPGAYTLVVSKSGYTFANPIVVPAVGPSQSVGVINAVTP